MKKPLVIIICLILLCSFVVLVYYGLRHSRGIPAQVEQPQRPTIEVPFIDKEIDLAKDIAPEIWLELPSQEIKLLYQLMVLPWPKPREKIFPVNVKAFHNQKDIYFYLSWPDDTEDRIFEMGKFSDACAMMFPMQEKEQPSSIMMGFLGKANIWQWKASQDREYWLKEERKTKAYADFHYPFEEEELFAVSKDIPKSSANDLMAIRVGTVTPKDLQNIQGRGFWQAGIWQVVFKRSLEPVDPEVDAIFKLGSKRLCAFAVWNGAKGDRGGRKSISDWVELIVH